MRGGVLHRRVKRNLGRIRANAYFARILQSRSCVRRAVEAHNTLRRLRKDVECVVAVIEWIRNWAGPMLIVLRSFRHRPDFVAAVVEPCARVLRGRKVLTSIPGIYKKKGMAPERDLHQPASELRHESER